MSRPVPAPQPDLSSRLLAAVAERDQPLAARLGQQWVHRRGLDALDRFLLTVLAPSQGLESAQWLRAQLGLVAASTTKEMPRASLAAPLVIEEVPIDEQELAALETELAAAPHMAQPHTWDGEDSAPVQRPALFGRMKALLRQCLEDAIVGIDDDEQPAPEPFAAPASAPAAAEPQPQRPLSLVPPLQASSSPAPAPASLASLRAWLPDAEEDGRDLPRAC